ncbi:MAG: methionyl-tRNA formyltransferase [Patescibacteria group bacterium]|nr:methionyl-tRNA formyltransferase [Patescibacteria group bacterium]MDE1966210.1 methionyl-tRNA formyltransferase [Patescibacteria group bacterium]
MSGTDIPRFAFFGTPYVARDTLACLASRGLVPAVVITSPDAKRGRGLLLTPSETKAFAAEYGIPVLTPETFDAQTLREIASYECPLAVVVAYGKILPEALIEAFPKGVLNIHYSLLPKYRGASPVEAALLAGDAYTGVAIQKMKHALDAGDIVAMEETPIAPAETTPELRARLITMGAHLLIGSLPGYLSGTLAPVPQDETRATYCKKIRKEAGLLSLNAPDAENWAKYRAYATWPGTYFFAERGGKDLRVKIAKASLSPAGAFVIERVVPEGKREMAYADFSRGG